MDLHSLSPEGSLNEEDISVHRQVSIDGDDEDEKQVGRAPHYILVTVLLENIDLF